MSLNLIRFFPTFLIVFFCVLTPQISSARSFELNAFQTDKCTLFPDGTNDFPELWSRCCVEHDLNYWMGGSSIDREIADLQFKQCVYTKGGAFLAWLMHSGVRIGGPSGYKAPWSWGYGWSARSDRRPLSSQEKDLVLRMLQESSEVDPDLKNKIEMLRLLRIR